jgi:TusA-related sulfurtransferase
MNNARQNSGKHQLDLTREAWPACLLKFKSELDQVAAGCLIEVEVTDADVVDSVGQILQRTAGRIIRIAKEMDRYRILIQWGVSPDERR